MTLTAVLPGDVAIGAASLVGFAESVSPDVIGVASPTGQAEVFPLAVAEVATRPTLLGRHPRALLGWRPQPLLLG